MNVNCQNAGLLWRGRYGTGILKSFKERMKRQEDCGSQIHFWEQQKEQLKAVERKSPESVKQKLEKMQHYDDQITAARMAYNLEQMSHFLDEAQELGEKIAKRAEELELKTPEERKREAVREAFEKAAGEEPPDGLLEEVEERTEQLLEEAEKRLEKQEKQKKQC